MRQYYYPLLLVFLLCYTQASSQTLAEFTEEVDQFLRTNVQNGQIDYQALADNPARLNHLVAIYTDLDISDESALHQKAFWINAYNIAVIKSVVDHYPITSPKAIGDFFNNRKHRIAGQQMSLNELENTRLLEVDRDPRLHFVLVCAARSCPVLINQAYRAATLDQQLNQQTQKALDDPSFLKIDSEKKKILLSEIFRWYVNDFRAAGGVRAFINQHRNEPLPKDFALRYYNYDWSLNDVKVTDYQVNVQPYRASQLLKKGQFELKIFNALYTQKEYNGFKQLNSRSNYFSSFIQYLDGSASNINYGFDLVFKSNRINDFASSSPFKVLQFQSTSQFQTFSCQQGGHNYSEGSVCHGPNGSSISDTLQSADGQVLKTRVQVGWAHIGPKIKFNPLKRFTNITLQQTIYFPLKREVDGQTISFTQLFFDRPIGSRMQLFIEASLWTPLRPSFRSDAFFKIFYSYFPSKRWTVYAMTSIPFEYGAGTKYFLTKNLEVEFLYTYYAPLQAYVGDTRPSTFNLGFRLFR